MTIHNSITTSETARCLWILQEAEEPITAAELAHKLLLGGARESRRRHVRAIVKQLRDDGAMIVATLAGGYWLTEDADIWCEYNEGRKIDAKRVLGEAHRRNKILREADGQGLLFSLVNQTGVY
jgi:hypothetical protein